METFKENRLEIVDSKEKKIVYILGAGASMPFIKGQKQSLSTKALTDILFEEKTWNSILDKFKLHLQGPFISSPPPSIGYRDIACVINSIQNLLNRNAYFKNINFEYVIHLLDKISDYISAKSLSQYGNIDTLLCNFLVEDNDLTRDRFYVDSNHMGWGYVPFLVREVVASSIIEFWELVPTQEDAIAMYKNHFNSLIKIFFSVNTYSLNYDPLLSFALNGDSNFSMGFTKEEGFETKLYLNGSNAITFLHGHTSFVPLGNKMFFENDIKNAQEKRFDNLFTGHNETKYWNFSMKGHTYNTYLITGLDKIGAFPNNPFSAYFYRFSRDIVESNCIVIIGTSLSDDHLKLLLRNYLVKPQNKVIFVTSIEPNKIRNTESERQDKIIMKLTAFFTNDSFSVKRHPFDSKIDPFEERYNDLANSVERVGYARLTNNVAIYANGSRSFFENSAPEEILGIFE